MSMSRSCWRGGKEGRVGRDVWMIGEGLWGVEVVGLLLWMGWDGMEWNGLGVLFAYG